MDGWRDQGVSFSQEVTRTKSNSYRKPPLGGSSNWQRSIPLWEKKFVASVGSVPWKKLVETKKCIHLYDNIIKWNDSAGKEAFQNAKDKFYANMHGLPCDKWLPDPDIYIDKIDWNSQVDPNLILDLDCDSMVPDSSNCKDEQVVIFGSSFPPSYQSFSPYGWGDSDDDKKKDPNNTSPEYNMHQRDTEWGAPDDNNNNNWWGWNEDEKRDEGWGWNMYDNNNHYYGDMPREASGRYMSRYKTSRFRRDDNQRSEPRRHNGNGNKKSNGYRPWKSTYSCAPVNPGTSPAYRWSVKKPVS